MLGIWSALPLLKWYFLLRYPDTNFVLIYYLSSVCNKQYLSLTLFILSYVKGTNRGAPQFAMFFTFLLLLC
jgi:hypothetical protein